MSKTLFDSLANPADLIKGLLSSAPSEPFNFKKVETNGKIVNYPIRVKLLRLEEDHMVLRDAQAYAKAQGEAPEAYGDIYRNAQAVELLTRALCHVDEHTRSDGTSYFPPLFTDSRQLRASFTSPELAQCLNMYELVKAKYGAIETFSDDEYERWRARLANPLRGSFFLSLLDSSHWPVLMCKLAQEAEALREQLGLPPWTSPDTSESDQTSSGPGTGHFSTLPEAHSENGEALPTDHLMTADEAKERSRTLFGKK